MFVSLGPEKPVYANKQIDTHACTRGQSPLLCFCDTHFEFLRFNETKNKQQANAFHSRKITKKKNDSGKNGEEKSGVSLLACCIRLVLGATDNEPHKADTHANIREVSPPSSLRRTHHEVLRFNETEDPIGAYTLYY